MHGIGNDFVLLDTIASPLNGEELPELSRRMNDRRFGIGGDGLILVERGAEAPFRMRMFNPDGSESEMCGNGIRCFARLISEKGYAGFGPIDVETGAGKLTVEVQPNGWVTVDMGVAHLERSQIPMTGDPLENFVNQPVQQGSQTFWGTAISMGNPHLVIFIEEVASLDLDSIGPQLEHHPLFPNRVNVHFAQVLDGNTLRQRTWERGAGITLACGTGACAVAVAGFLTGRSQREVTVKLPGGDLRIDYREDGRVMMTGPAETVFEGSWAG
jgi:diaminopimelate epimerase